MLHTLWIVQITFLYFGQVHRGSIINTQHQPYFLLVQIRDVNWNPCWLQTQMSHNGWDFYVRIWSKFYHHAAFEALDPLRTDPIFVFDNMHMLRAEDGCTCSSIHHYHHTCWFRFGAAWAIWQATFLYFGHVHRSIITQLQLYYLLVQIWDVSWNPCPTTNTNEPYCCVRWFTYLEYLSLLCQTYIWAFKDNIVLRTALIDSLSNGPNNHNLNLQILINPLPLLFLRAQI